MALISIIEDFHPRNDAKLLDKAAELAPSLHHTIVEPVGGFMLKERYSSEAEGVDLHRVRHLALEKGQNLCLDFGTHNVGYLTLEISYKGSHPDAPAFLKLKFAETYRELYENSENYNGWVSSSWIQEEYIHVNVLPATIVLPRRYAFRYLKITMMDTSPKYKLVVRHAECRTESSAGDEKLLRFHCDDELLNRIDQVSLWTLHNCMQDVFEDGPKRDQRLWMGDLRLQAMTNYYSYRNLDLVKRCLYLFAGSRFPDGKISANLFTAPTVEADDTYLFDYALFFACALEEYLQQKEDQEALDDLYDIAMVQIEIAAKMLEKNNLLNSQAVFDTFVDWGDDLDKAACAQAIFIYALRYARRLARRKNDWSQSTWISELHDRLKKAALANFWDEEKKCFVSNGQISLQSQMWMVLADVLSPEDAHDLMARSDEFYRLVPMSTPYAHHYYCQALIRSGHMEKAQEHIKEFWGSMLDVGADTFFEAWDPEKPDSSPYGEGGVVVNSFCHAWSCTPAYLIRKYFYPDLCTSPS